MTQRVSSNAEMIDYFIAFWLPPVGVFLRRGCGADLLINILLCSKCRRPPLSGKRHLDLPTNEPPT